MKLYLIAEGTRGVLRDLSKFCSFAPWAAPSLFVFDEQELTSIDGDRYSFKLGSNEYTVPVGNITLING
jgi:hypothetical protein